MNNKKLLLKRGKFNIMPTLDVGEPGVVTDNNKARLFIGSVSGNIEIANKDYVDSQIDTIEWEDIKTGDMSFNGVYFKRYLGRGNSTPRYADIPAADRTKHRFWRISFPTGVNFWGKIKISLYGTYSSFNASGKMSKEINVNFNGEKIYSNVGSYTELSGYVEYDFRISEAIWNDDTSQWEFLVYSDRLSGNNSPAILIEGWASSASYENAFNRITFTHTPELRADTTYDNVKGNALGQTLTKSWSELPTFQSPYGFDVLTDDMISAWAKASSKPSYSKSEVGLGNVDNTADADKPISTATQTALNLKANDSEVVKLSGEQTIKGNKTFEGNTVITGDLTVSGDNFIAETTTVRTNDDLIELRSYGETPITTPAGIAIKKYDGTNDGGIVIKDDGEVRVGKITINSAGKVSNSDAAQPVLTREEKGNLTNNDLLVWDGDNNRAVTKNLDTLEIVNTTTLDNHTENKENPHGVTKAQVGLENVDNTADIDKPISTATQSALNLKVEETEFYALNSDYTTHKGNKENPHEVTKDQVGLDKVDNTADADKPISTATQTALNLKANDDEVVRATTENKNILGTTQGVFNISDKKVWFNKGALFYGTALAAGLVTRGISGTNTSGSAKDHLYINYDGDNTLSRQLVLGAGSTGTNRGYGIYDYSAVRGDAFIAYLTNNIQTQIDDVVSSKVDKDGDKGLSTNDYTTTEKNKLSGIETGAEVNVQSDWNATSGDAFIKNKPTTFNPSSHSHSISNITNLQSTLNNKLETETDPIFTAWDKSTGISITKSQVSDLIAATQSLPGLMSATDKQRLDVLHALLEEPTSNNVVDSINEVLEIFNNYPEGADLVTALAGKVDKVTDKGLSTEDYTTAEKNKLSGIATGAEVNVQADWNETISSSDAYIQNKPDVVVLADVDVDPTNSKIVKRGTDGSASATSFKTGSAEIKYNNTTKSIDFIFS